jgi:hypothetical protein
MGIDGALPCVSIGACRFFSGCSALARLPTEKFIKVYK